MPATRTQQAIAGALLELPTKSPMPLGQSSQSQPKLSPMEPSLVHHPKGIDKPAADLAPLRLEILFFVLIPTGEPEIVLVAAYLSKGHIHLAMNEKELLHVLRISVPIVLAQGDTIGISQKSRKRLQSFSIYWSPASWQPVCDLSPSTQHKSQCP